MTPFGRTAAAHVPRRQAWELDEPAFRALLLRLDADPDRAGAKYEALRQKLILFFAGRRDAEPEESADETLDRLTRRISQGEDVNDIGGFAYGVARRVLSETVRRRGRRRRALDRLVAPSMGGASRADGVTACIGRCIETLAPADRALILEYYANDGKEQQTDRRDLAARLGISATALRLRVFRIRRMLEVCVRRSSGRRVAAERGGERA